MCMNSQIHELRLNPCVGLLCDVIWRPANSMQVYESAGVRGGALHSYWKTEVTVLLRANE